MKYYENAGIIGFDKNDNDEVTETSISLADGTMYHTAIIDPNEVYMTKSYVKDIQQDLDELPIILGFHPIKYLSQLEKYGLKIPTEKIVDLLDGYADEYELAQEWGEIYLIQQGEKQLGSVKERDLGDRIYRRMCNNDHTPALPPEKFVFEYLEYDDISDPPVDDIPF